MKEMNITKIAEVIANELEFHPYTVLKVLHRYNDICTTYDKNTPVFDKEFEYDEAIKNRTNYQLEAIKENIKEKYTELKAITKDLGSELDNYIDDYKEAYKHLDNADEALERRIKALEESRTRDWYELQQANKDITDLVNSVSDIRSIVNSSDIENISIKAMNGRMNLFSRELDSLSTAIDMRGKDIGSIVQKRCDDNRTINNMINDLNIRLKAIEKRLSIKPFYAPTEDEKDDD